MDISKILSISGYSGLFELIKQTKTGFVVESLKDKKRMQAFATSKISTLEDIAIYTDESEEHLKDIFKKIYEKEDGKNTINHKTSNEELKKYFADIVPDYDRERVYVSDIKKVINWYNILNEKGMIDLEEDKKDNKEENEKINKKEVKEKPKKGNK